MVFDVMNYTQQILGGVVSISYCGAQAGSVLQGLFEPLLITPHPAYRVVTNELWTEVSMLVAFGFQGTLRLEQGRGKIVRTLQ
jgi:hypothetical protein